MKGILIEASKLCKVKNMNHVETHETHSKFCFRRFKHLTLLPNLTKERSWPSDGGKKAGYVGKPLAFL